MSEPTKTHPTESKKITITISIPGRKETLLTFPGTSVMKKKIDQLKKLLKQDTVQERWRDLITPWEEATPWEEVAKDRIQRYSKVGLALRGARRREGLSQKELAKRC